MPMIASVFSGQGAQYAGMGQDLCSRSAEARRIYAAAADIVGQDLLLLDEEQLSQTRFTQLSVVTLSLAAWHALRENGEWAGPVAFAGFSAGEYSAIGAAGVLGLTDLLTLVHERARLMQQAAEATPGAMYAVLGLDDAKLLEIVSSAAYAGQVFAANFNCPGQIVIAGLTEAAEACAEALKAAGARRISRLKVNGAFHTPFMEPAARELASFAARMPFKAPAAPFYSNLDGGLLPADIDWPAYLASQMCHSVRWTAETLRLQQDGCTTWLEFGPGKILTGLIRKTLPGVTPWPVEDSRTLDEAVAALKAAQA
jgi:[acyl-carrier-protein] S-malonyltransferase